MGTILMEPEDIATYGGETGSLVKNFTAICTAVGRVNSKGYFYKTDPLTFSLPLLLLQLSVVSGIITLVSGLLKPLGQPIVVRQLLGGIILGPSLLWRNHKFSHSVFPVRGFIMLDAISSFGSIFYFFLIGVQMDPSILKKVERKSCALGFFSVAIPMVLTTTSCFLVTHLFNIEQNMARSLPVVAHAESVFSFPAVAHFLAELKIINSEFGRLALSSSMVGGLCSFSIITTIVLLLQQSPAGNYRALKTLSHSIILVVVIVFIIRPLIMRMIKHHPVGEQLKESYVTTIMVVAIFTGFCSKALGLDTAVGPLVLGITIPTGPPIGSALVDKLDLFTNWMFMPIYFIKNGLIVNISAIQFKNYVIVQSIALVGAFGKFLGTFLVSLCCRIPVKDAAALGFVMNAQGVIELGMFKMMKRTKAIDNEAFMIMCISMVLVNGAITPIIKYLYDPSRKYAVYRRRNVMESRLDSELRVLVCIHDQENVPNATNLLEALNPTKRSGLSVFVLHLTELVGRAKPLLIPHKLAKSPTKMAKISECVVGAFKHFQYRNHGLVSVHPFTAISPSKTMYDHVCSIALDKSTSLITVPFSQRFQANESCKKAIDITNYNVLEMAPCSVAIIVDRRVLKPTRSISNSCAPRRVAVLFLGGADDREALAIGMRMAGHPNINMTMIRLLENGNITSGNATEKRFDNEMLSLFRTATAGNHRVMYIEEVVMNGTGTVSVIRSMEDQYELVMVGLHHDQKSPLLSGLRDWNDHKELGTIGGVLASEQFLCNTTILVVQQHTNVVNDNQRETANYYR